MNATALPQGSAEIRQPLLEMAGISKTFPGVKALSDVRLAVHPGEVHALMGENGAGKSTLMKILSGAYRADPGGEIRIGGQLAHIDGPLSAKTLGIAVIYQELSLSPNLTVAENIYLGRELSSGGRVDRMRMRAECQGVLDRLGATFGPATVVSTLSIAERQMVEIARAIHANARILVMDEPTTALSSRETDKLFALIRTLRADGLAIIYISHRMAEVYELADRCSVLRDGSYVGTLMRDELKAETLVKMMVGRDLSKFYKKDHDAKGGHGEIILKVRAMSDGGRRVNPCSFDLHQGEVLALAGLVGSGRTELARLIYGADAHTTGTLELDGKPLDIVRPIQAVNAGIVYLTEDRKGQGLFLDMTVEENINLQVVGRDAGKGGLLDLKKARQRAVDAIKALSIRVTGPAIRCRFAVGRQPAEGAAVAPAGDAAARADPRRADARRRHRRQVRDLPHHRRSGEDRRRRAGHLLGDAGGGRHRRPRSGDARGSTSSARSAALPASRSPRKTSSLWPPGSLSPARPPPDATPRAIPAKVDPCFASGIAS